ncbi:MAG: hypothetical protein JNL74_06175 [Fibrobacteres bacterium]|nr:hypothetical protein [Fibrobacterota bacterium]
MKIIAALLISASLLLSAPFNHKVMYSECAMPSEKWAGGLRLNLALPIPMITTDLFGNINGWFDVDIVRSGWNKLKLDSNNAITDLFWTLGVRSKPFEFSVAGKPLYVAAGLKIFKSDFEIIDIPAKDTFSIYDNSFVLYLTESYRFTDRHRVNLHTSLSFRDGGTKTYYFIPSYVFTINERWAFNYEYYLTNTVELPGKIIQRIYDEDGLEFHNYKQVAVSFMFYGVSYSRKHLRLDFSIGNHVSFNPPFLVMTGIGWQF